MLFLWQSNTEYDNVKFEEAKIKKAIQGSLVDK
jgi:hypothetical protein